MAPAEANWSELPTELLNLISEQIDNEIDLIRFRSVCSSWRSSSIPNHFHISTFNVPLLNFPFDIESINNNTIPISLCHHLSKHNFYILKPPQQQTLINHPWLIRVTQNSCGKTKISQPEFLSTDDLRPDSFDFPFDALDFSKLSVQLAATSYFLFPDNVLSDYKICAFKGRIYVLVDEDGRTITVGPEDNPKVQLAAEPLVGFGDLKFLLESNGELLLVDVIYYDDCLINVFRLDEKEKKWVKFNNLEDRVLFIGFGYSFSASALDLCVPKGNCIIFLDNFFFYHEDMEHGMGIVHLDQIGFPSHLSEHPEYYDLLWPPPEWIIKSQPDSLTELYIFK